MILYIFWDPLDSIRIPGEKLEWIGFENLLLLDTIKSDMFSNVRHVGPYDFGPPPVFLRP